MELSLANQFWQMPSDLTEVYHHRLLQNKKNVCVIKVRIFITDVLTGEPIIAFYVPIFYVVCQREL